MPVIRISEKLFSELKKYAEPLEDNVETTVWKILRLVDKKSNREIPKELSLRSTGELTPPSEFWRPILGTLVERGGRASRTEIHKIVERKMGSRLKPSDYEPNRDGTAKWAKQVDYQRLAMVHEGLLKSDSPRGTWEITDQGRAWLSQHQEDN